MQKIVKVLKKDYNKFKSYAGNFNRILCKNGEKANFITRVAIA